MVWSPLMTSKAWPPVTWEERPWVPLDRGESHRARLRSRGPYHAAVPPFIADRGLPDLDPEVVVGAEEALMALARFDDEVGDITAPFASILLRSESSSSSEIEQLTASPKNIALAELGVRSGPNSRLVVANVRAMQAAIDLAGSIDEHAILAMQDALLHDSHPEYTGAWRQQPVWIGSGYANGPHLASFVPPHHERVPELMRDLVTFAGRLDLPALAQVAVAHAQFETIHPFPDGNGRTGRALVHAMLHHLGVTRSVAVPISAGLLQDLSRYFGALTAYRAGNVQPIIEAFSRACLQAVSNGRLLVRDVTAFEMAARAATTARRGSAAWRTIDAVLTQPVTNAASLAATLGVTPQNAQAGIDRLVADGVLSQVGQGRRNRLYQADALLQALDAFAARARRGSPPAASG